MTHWFRTLRMSTKSLLLHPMRSGLTVLGILIGVSSVIWLLAIGEGISQKSREQIESLGTNNIIVRTIKPSSDEFEGGPYGLTRTDYQRIKETIPTLQTVLPIRELRREFRYKTRRLEGRLVGCTPDYQDALRLKLENRPGSRFLTDADLDEERNYCVLAAEVADQLFPIGDAIGRAIMIDEEFYTVVGVMQPRAATAGVGGSLAAEDFSSDVYIPITTLWRRQGDMEIITKPGQFQQDVVQLSQITVQVANQRDVLKTAGVLHATVEDFHDQNDFAMTVPLELLQQARTTQLMFILFLGMIAAISLVVGGIGIMNIMLATVTERTREIGIRRAVGAKRSDIIQQFLTESVVLSIVGGLLGIGIGLLCEPLLLAVRTLLFWQFPDLTETLPELIRDVQPVLVGWSIPLAFAISAVVGVVFGVYPARKAAGLDPIVALRHE